MTRLGPADLATLDSLITAGIVNSRAEGHHLRHLRRHVVLEAMLYEGHLRARRASPQGRRAGGLHSGDDPARTCGPGDAGQPDYSGHREQPGRGSALGLEPHSRTPELTPSSIMVGNLLTRRFLYRRPALLRTVHDLGLVSSGCAGGAGAPARCST